MKSVGISKYKCAPCTLVNKFYIFVSDFCEESIFHRLELTMNDFQKKLFFQLLFSLMKLENVFVYMLACFLQVLFPLRY